MKSPSKSLFVIALLAASVALTPVAQAADGYSLVLQQSELASITGLQQVHARMLLAATDYCPTYLQIRSHADVATCIEGVVDDLTAKIGDERLSNYIATLRNPAPVHGELVIARESGIGTSRRNAVANRNR